MAGSGKLTLTGVHAYTGDTWISSGTLALSGSGSIASSSNLVVSIGARLDATARTDGTLRVGAGQTLSGFGSVLGKVVVTNNAVISPGGDAIGALTFNSSLNLAGGQAWLAVSKTGGVLANDFITGVTTLTYGGTLVVTNSGPDALITGDSFKLFNAASYAVTFTNYSLPPLATNLVWNTSGLVVNGTIAVAAAIQAPVINGGAMLTSGGVQFSFSGPNGQSYKVLGTTNLSIPMTNWVVLTNGTFGVGPATFTDPAATNPAGFYRVVSP
jgi:autotransporter-associated beta strand protein